MSSRHGVVGLAMAIVVLSSIDATATQRRFTYTYESLVLNRGDIELEPWTTFRLGRNEFYSRLDNHLELEIGLTERLQMSWYLNSHAVNESVSPGLRASSFEFEGISNEWKFKLSDPVADVLGSALYFEWSAGPLESDIEGKIILDKRFGPVLAALNLVAEQEWELGPTDIERELELEADLGVAYFLNSSWSVGLEARSHNEIPTAGWESSALFLGPTISYSQPKWWVAASVLPQLVDFKASGLDLKEHERLNARVLLGVHL